MVFSRRIGDVYRGLVYINLVSLSQDSGQSSCHVTVDSLLARFFTRS